MAFWTYIIKCADSTYYTGHTEDLDLRMAQHRDGYFPACYTRDRRPLDLAWASDFPSRIEALEAERKIKGWSRAKKEALIRQDWEAVQRLARRRKSFETPSLPTASTPPQDERELVGQDNRTNSVRPEEGQSISEGPSRRTAAPENPISPLPFLTYMLRCADSSYYVGYTDDIDLALAQHREGTRDEYTAKRLPVELVWSTPFAGRDAAFAAERRLKGWSRAKREALIAGDPAMAMQLATMAPVSRVGDDTPSMAVPRENQPVIVLVRPQLGENIGKTARAMLNFGLSEIRLVDPRDGWPNPSAGPAAAGANMVLEHAQVFDTLAEAVADCAHVYATTVRKRGVIKPVVTPEQAALAIHKGPGRSAIVFGPERSGLESEDVALARAIITVPINPEFASLNLAQAVILCAYEWSKHVGLAQPTAEELLPPAPQAELEGMIGQLEAMLEPRGYYFPGGRASATRLTLRSLLTKPGWNHLEVRTLRGVLSTLRRKPDEG